SVVGYNDMPDAARADPPLTTVDSRTAEKGTAAARMVFAGGTPRHEILEPRLIVRASAGPPRAA
ncbi:MAG: substrate-binding domain-containing protein, partial [Rhizobiales bacterium]|nr:substrate-binding domain-containing protein [Hyphomicrobiales bacterium]